MTDTTTATCPECGGPWLYNYKFRHALGCTLGHAQDQTRANDHGGWHRIVRTSTPAELALLAAFGVTASNKPMTIVCGNDTAMPVYIIDRFNPDQPDPDRTTP